MSEIEPTRLFGTDGIRGRAGEYPLDPKTVTKLGAALGRRLRVSHADPVEVVIGGDTRASGPGISFRLAAGLASEGVGTRYAGVIPTAGVAMLVRDLGAAAGIAVSASHNPAGDNGIKLFDQAGFKWRHQAEVELEAQLRQMSDTRIAPSAGLEAETELAERYAASLLAPYRGGSELSDLELVLDCANGAASRLAPLLFTELGAHVKLLSATPDGANINLACGSTKPEALCRATASSVGALGFAFDGDADRAVASDETGRLHDGDALLYLWARDLKQRRHLDPPTVVATTMSNIGLERALGREGIGLVRCAVGDREVVATLLREGLKLGGEQSGHVVNLEMASTGDGLQTALAVASIVARAGEPLSHLLKDFRRYPQVLINVPVASKPDLDTHPVIGPAALHTRELLGSDGRLVLRYSGTEPLARVMIEGREQETIEALASSLAALIGETLHQPRHS